MADPHPDDAVRIQKVCTLWTHDPSFSTEEVVFNADRFPELRLKPGSLAQIIPIYQGTSVRDFQVAQSTSKRGVEQKHGKHNISHHSHDGSQLRNTKAIPSPHVTFDENGSYITTGKDTDESRSYVFVASDASPEMKQKYPNLQVNHHSKICFHL
jgi:hypothetical protein